MDPKDKMPDIKTEVNKLDDGKKKPAGLLAALFGGGSGSAGGLGGSAAGGGGMLATKAGMLALVIMGTAVAGGIGMAGYKVFGPGESDRTGGSLALFAPKPEGAQADPNAVAPVKADGSSTSLDYMAQAAAKDRAAEAAATAASEQASAAASGAAAAVGEGSSAGAAGVLNGGSGGAGAIGSMGKGLAGVKKLGELSKSGAGGAASSASAGGGKLGDSLASTGQSGSLSAFSKNGSGARASANSGRGIASRRSVGSQQQLGAVRRDHVGATSSVGAGKTYDGASNAGSAIGPGGSAIGMDGAGAGGEAQPKSIAKNSAANDKKLEPPMPVAKHVGTTWQDLSKRAMMLGLLVAALALLAYGLKKANIMSAGTLSTVLQAIGVAIIGIGAYIGMMAGQIITGVGGEPGQKLQGAFVAMGALAAIATGVMVMSMAETAPPKMAAPPAGPGATPGTTANLAANPGAASQAASSAPKSNFTAPDFSGQEMTVETPPPVRPE